MPWDAWTGSRYADTPALDRLAASGEGPWKLCVIEGYPPQLFNLEADPGEFRDRSRDPGCAGVQDSLLGRARELWDPEDVRRRMAIQAKERAFLAEWVRRTAPEDPFGWPKQGESEPENCVFPFPEAELPGVPPDRAPDA